MSAYPGSLDSFTTKQDGVDLYLAAHMNAVQSSIVAEQSALGTNPQGSATDLKTRLAVGLNDDGTRKPGLFTPNYDSGWVAVNQDQSKVFTHNLGSLDTFVYIEGKHASLGIHQFNYGGVFDGNAEEVGMTPYNKTTTQITCWRRLNDSHWAEIRVRMWLLS
ncbi:MAG: hypothetical protein KAV00_03310 [Phycisphaerae bacterium]|nr:hypothetical protein [Phycisphaerae bacterium]